METSPASIREVNRSTTLDLAKDTLALAVRMLRAAEDELDCVLLAVTTGDPPPAERIEKVQTSYLEARSLAARAHDFARLAGRSS